MRYAVEFTPEAEDDLVRLFGFLLDRAETAEDLALAEKALEAIRATCLHHLALTPYSYRKVGASPTRRELIIPFATTGYVACFEIRSPELVLVLGVRHQREKDYH